MPSLHTDFTTTYVHGANNRRFLQQLCTQDVLMEHDTLLYCAFLTRQGRVLLDAYIHYPDSNTAWVIHPACQSATLVAHLERYAPFSKITVTQSPMTWDAQYSAADSSLRLPHLPYALQHSSSAALQPQDAWLRIEILHGIPRVRHAHSGLWTAHMLEMDKAGAISLRKGCYLGQEITHRTALLGTAKKGLYRGITTETPLLYSAKPTPLALYVLEHSSAPAHCLRVYA